MITNVVLLFVIQFCGLFSNDYDEEAFPKYLMNIEVSTKTAQYISLAPNAVSIITRADIERLNLTSLEDAIRLIPGFYINKDQNDGIKTSIQFHGLYHNSGDTILILKDGFRINDGYQGSAMMFTRRISLINVERIEVIRGPGYTLYGANALYGVIHIITKSAQNRTKIGTGSSNTRTLASTFTGKMGDLTLDLSFDLEEDLGAKYQVQDPIQGMVETQDPHRENIFGLQLRKESWLLDATLSRNNLWDFYGSERIVNGVIRDFTWQDRVGLSRKWQTESGDSWNLSFSYAREKAAAVRRFDLTLRDTGTPIAANLAIQIQTNVTNARIERSLLYSDWLNLYLGMEYFEEAYPSTSYIGLSDEDSAEVLETIGALGRDLSLKGKIPSTSFFLQDQLLLSPTWNLTLGWRGEKRKNEDLVNLFRVGFVKDTPRSTWKFHYGEGIRNPSPRELSGVLPDGTGLENLDSERSRSAEISYWRKKDKSWQTFHFFYYYLYNVFLTNFDIPAAENHQDFYTETYGFEWEDHLALQNGVTLDLNWTQVTHNASWKMPAWQGSGLLQTAGKKFWQVYELRVQDEIPYIQRSTKALICNAQCAYQPRAQMTFRFEVKNLFDRQLYYYADSIPQGIPQRGREWRASATWLWQ